MTDRIVSDESSRRAIKEELESAGLLPSAPGVYPDDEDKGGSEAEDIYDAGWDDESEDITDMPAELLRHGADTYERKNEDYGASWYEIGEVLYKMAGEEPVTLDSPEDWVRAGLYTRRMDKMFRSFNGEFRSESMNYEASYDAHGDEGVYAHMAAAVAMMEQLSEREVKRR